MIKPTSFRTIFTHILIGFFGVFNPLFSQNTIAPKYSNEFLALGVGADAAAMGNAVVAQTNNANSAYWNPAGLVHSDKWLEGSLMHSEHFAGIAKYDYLGLSHKIDERSAAAFSAIRFAVDDIPNTTQLIDREGNLDYDRITLFTAADYAFLFSYARKTKIEGLNLGGNVKIIHRRVGDFARSWGFGIDAGAQYKWKKMKFGAVIRDASSTFNAWIFDINQDTKDIFLATGNALPENGLELTLPRIILGAYRNWELGQKGFSLAGEVDFDITTDRNRNTIISSKVFSIDPHAGISFGFKSIAYVRAGVSNLQYVKEFDDSRKLNLQPAIGVGLNIKNFSLDYAFTNVGGTSVALYSNVVSLRIRLDKPNNSIK